MTQSQGKQAVYIALTMPMTLISGVAYLEHVDDTWTLHYTDNTEESAILPARFANDLAQDNPFRIISAVQSHRGQ